jgi:uncharacterized protein (TIGR02246 family)
MRLARTLPFAAPLLFVALATSVSLHAADPGGGLSASEEAKIRGVLKAYRKAWLANDADGVLRVFSDDAVLMPHHGVEPVVGKAAARAFWFPAGPPTTITAFTLTVDQVGGVSDMAWARGHSRVEWVTGTGPEAKRSGNAGTNLAVLRRQKDGSWRVAVMMWDDPPTR